MTAVVGMAQLDGEHAVRRLHGALEAQPLIERELVAFHVRSPTGHRDTRDLDGLARRKAAIGRRADRGSGHRVVEVYLDAGVAGGLAPTSELCVVGAH